METGGNRAGTGGRVSKTLDAVRRAFAEFLTIPSWIIAGFLLLALGAYLLDRANLSWLVPLHDFLKTHLLVDAESTRDLLGTVANGIITVTSITISLLLIAVQQSASSMTSHVLDQFLRRWHNQAYFGFFVGLAVYSLITLATVTDDFNPVIGATLAIFLTLVALYLLLLMFYTTLNQMRPVVIVEAIHGYILAARVKQLLLMRGTRRQSCYQSSYAGSVILPIKATRHGFVTHLDIAGIDTAARALQGQTEVVLLVSTGSFVAFQDVIAEVRAETEQAARAMVDAAQAAIHLERQRDIGSDPAYGIEQLEMIAWVSISTAQSNPLPGLLTIRSLRDIMARWCTEQIDDPEDAALLTVVCPDDAFFHLMHAFESLAVASSESLQHQNFTEIVFSFALMFERLPVEHQPRAEDLILRILSALGDHVLTAELNEALSMLVATLTRAQRADTAQAVQMAQTQLALSVGKLNSRSTRTRPQ